MTRKTLAGGARGRYFGGVCARCESTGHITSVEAARSAPHAWHGRPPAPGCMNGNAVTSIEGGRRRSEQHRGQPAVPDHATRRCMAHPDCVWGRSSGPPFQPRHIMPIGSFIGATFPLVATVQSDRGGDERPDRFALAVVRYFRKTQRCRLCSGGQRNLFDLPTPGTSRPPSAGRSPKVYPELA